MGDRRASRRGLVLLAALVFVGLVALWLLAPASRGPLPVPSGEAEAGPDRSELAAIDPLDGIWWALEPTFDGPSDLVGVTVVTGSFRDGTTSRAIRDLPHLGNDAMLGGIPFAFGPVAAGEVGYGLWTGQASELRAVTSATGADRLLLKSLEVVHAAAFDREAGNLYYIGLDPQDRLNARLMRAAIPGGRPIMIAELPPEETSTQVDLRVIVSADGRWVMVVDCRVQCVALGYPSGRGAADAAAEPEWTVTVDGYDALGATDAVFFAGQACGAPCELTVVALDSGDNVEGIRFCDAAVTVANSRGVSTIVSDASAEPACEAPDYGLYSWVDPAVGVPPRQIAGFGTRQRTLVARNGPSGYDLPAGWLVVGPHGQLTDDSPRHDTPLLVNVDSGAVVEGHSLTRD